MWKFVMLETFVYHSKIIEEFFQIERKCKQLNYINNEKFHFLTQNYLYLYFD